MATAQLQASCAQPVHAHLWLSQWPGGGNCSLRITLATKLSAPGYTWSSSLL